MNLRTRIKICGITSLKDAIDAIEAGADALGFVFYNKSARYIEPESARKIIKQLPSFVQMVGLFVNETQENIKYITQISTVDIAQIHFDTDDSFFNTLDVKYIKVVRAKNKEDILKYNNEYRLVDAFVPEFGGEGKRLNLEWFDGIDCSKITLAGGLTQDNLKDLKNYNFCAVDVSSGVEISKGLKDKQKMISFCKEVNAIS